MRKKIIVRGPVLTQSGYGEQARFALRALRAHEDKFDIHIVPVEWGQTGWTAENNEEKQWMDFIINKTNHALNNKIPFDMSLQITIPNEWEKIAPINIGWTAGIESDKIAPEWIQKSELMDKIVVVSNHAKYGFDNTEWKGQDQTGNTVVLKNTVPVETVNYAVRKWEPTEIDLNLEYDFNFLAVAQWGPRKNLPNTVKWFVEEFHDQKVGMVLKTNLRKNCIIDRIEAEKQIARTLQGYEDHKCKIYLLHGDMEQGEMAALYEHPKIKCLVSLSHGEGFGLPIFEAACHGLPVMAPEWGGQCDFLYAPVKSGKKTKMKPMFSRVNYVIAPIQDFAHWEGVLHPESNWCYPEAGSFKMRLRNMKSKYAKHLKNAQVLQKYVLEEFAHEKQYQKFADALLDVVPEIESKVKVFG
tara:strand:+ start:5245 stop:6483 length:1239 start_codon:yes stop_codon:yes gene_type:complete